MTVRYVYSPTSGNYAFDTGGTTGGTAVGMPNNGVSLIEGTSTEVYVLAPPPLGVMKTIVCVAATTTVTPTVRLSTNAAQGITLTGGVPATIFKFAATRSTVADPVVQMLGRSSIAWTMVSVYPAMATGAGVGAITLSTT